MILNKNIYAFSWFRTFAWQFIAEMLKKKLFFGFILLLSITLYAQKKKASPQQTDVVIFHPVIDREALITYAKKFLGTTYKSAGTDPKNGFDCSGFVRYVFGHFDLVLPRSSREYKTLGVSLKPEEFRVGDILIFYGYKDSKHIGHVGIICEANGMKSKFIHASSGKAKGVTISNLGSEGYKRRFYKCIDVIGQ